MLIAVKYKKRLTVNEEQKNSDTKGKILNYVMRLRKIKETSFSTLSIKRKILSTIRGITQQT